jgi:glycosyltransferase involved in cell wall biosynthesis
VLIIVQNLPVPADRRVWLECKALVAAGHAVTVVCPKGIGDPDYEILDQVVLRKYAPPPPTAGLRSYIVEFVVCWLRTAKRVHQAWRHEGFDVIQTCNPPDTYWLLGMLFKARGVRYVFDQHDLCPEVYQSRFARPNRMLLRMLKLLELANYKVADHVIVTNESYKALAISRGRRRPDDVTVVRSGPDADRFIAGDAVQELREDHRFLACYVGVMGPQDGVDRALYAAAHYIHELGRTDCLFVFLGRGDCLKDLVELASELDIANHVTFPGWANDDSIHRYLSTADIGLCPDPPSPLNDVSTMNKTLEYMSFGLPIVSFDLKETRVSAAGAAVYLPGEDITGFATAIAALLDDPADRRMRGDIGRRRIESELSWRHQEPVYISLFD